MSGEKDKKTVDRLLANFVRRARFTDATLVKSLGDSIVAAITGARAETWGKAIEIANVCVQQHDHSETGDPLDPAACVYLALEAAKGKDGR